MARNKTFFIDRICEIKGLDPTDSSVRERFADMSIHHLVMLLSKLEESESPIAGEADVLIVPNVEAGNIVAKGLQYFARARMAGLVVGAKVPIIISSRADSAETRYLSLAMAVVVAASARDGISSTN